MSSRRRGYAMLVVLWVLTVGSVLAAAAAADGRTSVETTRNRVALERARWTALGCARTVQAAIDGALRRATSSFEATQTWLAVGGVANVIDARCRVGFEATGTRLDLNAATADMLERALAATGVSEREADDAARAFEQWRHDSSFDDPRQLRRMAEFARLGSVDSLFSADAGRVSLATASPPVLMALPGVTRETADTIANRARAGTPITDLGDLLSLISGTSRAELTLHFPDAVRLSTAVPDGWILRVAADAGEPRVTATLRWLLLRAPDHVELAQSRELP